MAKRSTVSDGKLVLNLEEAEEGGYIVTSPLNPELITQAETIEEAFANARDAAKALKQSRARLKRLCPHPRHPASLKGSFLDLAVLCLVQVGDPPPARSSRSWLVLVLEGLDDQKQFGDTGLNHAPEDHSRDMDQVSLDFHPHLGA